MKQAPALLIHQGRTAHVRHAPFSHRFTYPIWMVSVDLDQPQTGLLFGRNRLAPLTLLDRDHGPRDGSPLAPWVRARLAEADLTRFGARIRMMAIPRVWGFAFNPIAFYFCYDAAGQLGAVLHQVKNTFGDQHGYLLPVAADQHPVRQRADKRLHVSPFFDLAGGYRFIFAPPDFTPGGRFDISIRYGAGHAPRLTATLSLGTKTANSAALLGLLIRQPWMPVMVVFAIHWQALRLWWRGAMFHSAPVPPVVPVSSGALDEPDYRVSDPLQMDQTRSLDPHGAGDG